MFCWRPDGSQRCSEDPKIAVAASRLVDSFLQDLTDLDWKMSQLLFTTVEQSNTPMLWFQTSQIDETSQHIPSGQSL